MITRHKWLPFEFRSLTEFRQVDVVRTQPEIPGEKRFGLENAISNCSPSENHVDARISRRPVRQPPGIGREAVMKDFQGRTAFLTGAASGIGYELALQLASSGCHLFLVDIDRAGLHSLKERLRSFPIQVWTCVCNLADPASITQATTEALDVTGGIDLLINNAGVAYYGKTSLMTQQQWNWIMGVNLLAPIQITHELLPSLLERPDTHIVNMCSISGLVAGGRFAAYHTSKFGLVGFTEARCVRNMGGRASE